MNLVEMTTALHQRRKKLPVLRVLYKTRPKIAGKLVTGHCPFNKVQLFAEKKTIRAASLPDSSGHGGNLARFVLTGYEYEVVCKAGGPGRNKGKY